MALIRRKFGWLNNLFGIVEKFQEQAPKIDPAYEEIAEQLPIMKMNVPPKTEVSTLANGVTVLTETPAFPGMVHLGIMCNLGARDETPENSGSLMALKHTYLRTNSKEQVNYGMIQMSAGSFSMDFDHEKTYLQASCFENHIYEYMQMMAESLLNEKTQEDCQVAKIRLEEFWSTREYSVSPEEILRELVLPTAFGGSGLGMPLQGLKKNIENINSLQLNSLISQLKDPDGIIVCCSGLENHKEFTQLAKTYFENLPKKETRVREPCRYKGGEVKEKINSETTYVNLSFEGGSWNNMGTFLVMKTILEAGKSKAANVGLNYPYLELVEPSNSCFSETGVFGLSLSGPSQFGGQFGDILTKTFQALTNVSEEEVAFAKNYLKYQVLFATEKAKPRLEETVRTYMTIGKLSALNTIESVKTEDIKKTATSMLKTRPTLVALGPDLNSIPSSDGFHSRLN